jgi:hypothetical protein
VLPSGWARPQGISRNGVALEPLPIGYGYDAGELEPNTSYTFQVEIEDYGWSAPPLELTFTTGAGPANVDPGAAPGVVVTSSSTEGMLSELCDTALWTQGCFDTGQDTYYRFTPSGSAKGWLLMANGFSQPRAVWPGECGAPTLFGGRYEAPCATLYGIDATGELHAGEEVCAPAATPLPDPSRQDMGEPTTTAAVTPPEGEPTASNDTSASEASRGSATIPVQSSTNGGCSLAAMSPISTGFDARVCGIALGVGLTALGRIRRRR